MNGHQIAAKVIDTLPGMVNAISGEEKSNKKLQYEWDQLYMIKFAKGFKRYYYSKDTTINNWFTRSEMWMYMKGERDARKGFKARGALYGSAVVGLFGGMTGTFWAPVLPYGFMALSGLPKIRIKHSTVSNEVYLKSEPYILGYERVARQKLKTKSLLGGTIGLILGYTVYALFHESYPESTNVGISQ